MATALDHHSHATVRIPFWARPAHPIPASRPIAGDSPMTNIFAVVGEHRDDPDRLLVIGQDGNAYDYKVPTGQFMPTEPQEEDWHVDTEEPDLEEIFFDGSQ